MTENNNILVFSLAYQPYIGGAEIALQEIATRLAEYRFDIITARFDKKNLKQEARGQIRVFRVGWGVWLDKYLFFILAYFKAKELHKKNNYKIVWGMMENYAGLAALLFKKKYKIKYLLTLQSGDSDKFIKKRTWFWQPLYRQIYTRADKIQAISKWLERRAKNYGYRGEIALVPNGVEFGMFDQKINQEERKNLLNQLSLKPDDKIIITISRLVEKNGIGDLIEAMKYLDDRYKLLIIGEGKLERELKLKTEDFQSKADTPLAEKLSNRVKFLGQIDNDELYKYLSIADVFIRPSITEGFGIAFLEAMAASVPVIATNVGGIKDFLFDNETGLVCQVNNPQSIAEQVKKLEDEQLRIKIITQALAKAREYDWNEIVKKMRVVFEDLIC